MVSARAARKTVSVLFCDLTSSTELGERLDPETLRTMMESWFEAMRASVERHGGTVEKFIGDAVMAVFGIPRVHEDDALRAVRAALEMRDAVTPLNRDLPARDLPELHVRIGVNTGEVVTGDPDTTLLTGDAVNTAKRLEEAAATDEILIGETTRRLIGEAVELGPAPRVRARGKRLPLRAWRVLGPARDVEGASRRLDAPLVGRRAELALLRRELERVAEEQVARIVTVLGAAGIGKSRLAAELLDEVGARVGVLAARCVPYGDGVTFLPLADLVRSAGGEDAVVDAVAEESDGALIAERLRGALGSSSAPVSNEEAFWAIRRLFETLARDRPLVVALEDVHWAAPTFLDLLEYVVGWSRGAPILLLCVARPDLLDARPRWPGALVKLEPLTTDEANDLLATLASAWPLDERTTAEIRAVAEGNPLFIEQLVAALAERRDPSEIPPTIHALLAARLDSLAPKERAVLERAAVAGREFWRGTIAELSPAEERPTVGATLLALVRKELVRPEPSGAVAGDDCFRFRHALIRDAAYAAIPKRVRAELHERVAVWLERLGAEDEVVAYHLEQSHRYGAELGLPDAGPAAARAGTLLAAAGRRAFARNDAPAAANLLLRASALLEDDAVRIELLRLAGLALWWSGETERAREIFARQIALARESGNAAAEWSARLERAAADLVSGSIDAQQLLAVAEHAIQVLEDGDDAGLARAWRRVAHAHCARGRYGPAVHASERALQHARAAGERFEEARIVDLLCTSLLYGPTPVDEAVARCERMLAEAHGDAVQ